MMKGVSYAAGRLPLVGHLWRLGRQDFHAALAAMHKDSGRTFILDAPMTDFGGVVTADAALAQHVFSSQGADAIRGDQWSVTSIFEKRGWPQSVLFTTGKTWHAQRRVLNRTLMQQSAVLPFADDVDRAADALAATVAASMKASGDGRVQDLKRLLGHYAVQAIMPALCGVVPDLVTPNPGPTVRFFRSDKTDSAPLFSMPREQMERLADDTIDAFDATIEAEAEPWARYGLPSAKYRRLEELLDRVGLGTLEIVDGVMKATKSKKATEAEQGLKDDARPLTVLERALQEPDIAGSDDSDAAVALFLLVDSLTAAIDTSSQTIEFLLMHLARSPDVQARARAEVADQTTAAVPTARAELPYLRACLKESMRLTPTVNIHARTLVADLTHTAAPWSPDAPLVLPKGTVVIINGYEMALDAEYVVGPRPPTEFDPVRFLRKADARVVMREEKKQHNASAGGGGCPVQSREDGGASCAAACPYKTISHAAAIPFGHGSRRCPGAGFAQVSVLAATASLLRRFDVALLDPRDEASQSLGREVPAEFMPVMKGVMRPATPVAPLLRFAPMP